VIVAQIVTGRAGAMVQSRRLQMKSATKSQHALHQVGSASLCPGSRLPSAHTALASANMTILVTRAGICVTCGDGCSGQQALPLDRYEKRNPISTRPQQCA
jgi:hypothetical protein